ncbi:MAG: hypothetical protein IMZ66_01695, partial [Planctomycetes bacterium]|nr:hypothetical protein [Planctomycetota bacterium]
MLLAGGTFYVVLLSVLAGRTLALDETVMAGPTDRWRAIWALVHLLRTAVLASPAALLLALWHPWAGAAGLGVAVALTGVSMLFWRAEYRHSPGPTGRRHLFVSAVRAVFGLYLLQLTAAMVLFLASAGRPHEATGAGNAGPAVNIIPIVGIWFMMNSDTGAEARDAAGTPASGPRAPATQAAPDSAPGGPPAPE